MWKQLSEEQRHSYGEDYFEAALRSLEKYTEYVSVFITTKETNLFMTQNF